MRRSRLWVFIGKLLCGSKSIISVLAFKRGEHYYHQGNDFNFSLGRESHLCVIFLQEETVNSGSSLAELIIIHRSLIPVKSARLRSGKSRHSLLAYLSHPCISCVSQKLFRDGARANSAVRKDARVSPVHCHSHVCREFQYKYSTVVGIMVLIGGWMPKISIFI